MINGSLVITLEEIMHFNSTTFFDWELDYLKQWEHKVYKLRSIPMVACTLDCVVTHHNLPICCRSSQFRFKILADEFDCNLEKMSELA